MSLGYSSQCSTQLYYYHFIKFSLFLWLRCNSKKHSKYIRGCKKYVGAVFLCVVQYAVNLVIVCLKIKDSSFSVSYLALVS